MKRDDCTSIPTVDRWSYDFAEQGVFILQLVSAVYGTTNTGSA